MSDLKARYYGFENHEIWECCLIISTTNILRVDTETLRVTDSVTECTWTVL